MSCVCAATALWCGTDHDVIVHSSPSEVIVQKGRHMKVDSYSGFGDATGGSLEKTILDDKLKEHKIGTVRAGIE